MVGLAHRREVGLGLDPQVVRAEARDRDRVGVVGELEREREMRFHGTAEAVTDENGIDPTARPRDRGMVAAWCPRRTRQFEAFLRSYYAQVPAEDLEHRNRRRAPRRRPLPLGPRAAARTRVPRSSACSHPSAREDGWDANHTIVDIVNDDMPFLVDSVTMELDRHDLGVHLVVHPIVRVRRDADGRLLGLATGGADDPRRPRGDGARVVPPRRGRPRDRSPRCSPRSEPTSNGCWATCARPPSDWLQDARPLRQVGDELATAPPAIDADELTEGTALLRWMADQHFTFLGYRTYDLAREDGEDVLRAVPGTGLGILRGAVARCVARASPRCRPRSARKARERTLLVLTKANPRSTVHRPTYLDYVGVRRFDADGNVIGEHRFLGLYTSSAYNANPIDVPVLRRKVAAVDRTGRVPARRATTRRT